MTLRRFALLALVLATSTATAARADVVVAPTTAPTPIAAGQGVVAFSSFDAAAKSYRLQLLQNGAVTTPDVPPSASPFDVDIGPTSSGHAYLVYSRCPESGGRPSYALPGSDCDLYAYNPATGREAPVHASDPGHADVHPTYWRGRLAWVRYYGTVSDPRPVVYTRATPSSHSERLPGLPARRCVNGAHCDAVRGRFDDLELYGRRLAQVAFAFTPRQDTELRLVDVDRGTSEQLATRGSGEGGQQWLGPSFEDGQLYAAFTSNGGGCGGLCGIYRDRYAHDTWQRASAPESLIGFAVADGRTLQSPGFVTTTCDPDVPCGIVERQPPPSFTATKAPR